MAREDIASLLSLIAQSEPLVVERIETVSKFLSGFRFKILDRVVRMTDGDLKR